MTSPQRVTIVVQELPAGAFQADAVLPYGDTSVTVVRTGREEAIKQCANACHRLAAEQGYRVTTVLPYCQPDWSLAYYERPAFRQYDPNRTEPIDPPVLPSATREGQAGSVAIDLTEMMGDSE